MLNYEKIFHEKKSILVTGETGVGKTSFVKHLHQKFRPNYPLVSLNLSGLPDQFFESELYGYKKGAFTGAINARAGLLKKAHNGLVFLDEIGDLNPTQQLKILKLIDEKVYYPIGDDSPQYFSGQFIFATHKNLSQLVEQGKFREDLYFRIVGLQVKIEPLRNKREKIRKCLWPYKNKMTASYFEYLCEEYSWPGNIRELNLVKDRLEYTDMDIKIDGLVASLNGVMEKPSLRLPPTDSYYEALSEFEKIFLQQKLSKFKGKLNKTAQVIGLSKSTLIAKLRKYGINNLEIKAMSQVVGTDSSLKSAA